MRINLIYKTLLATLNGVSYFLNNSNPFIAILKRISVGYFLGRR